MRKWMFAVFFLVCCFAVAAQQTMNNDSIIKMVKAGLSDDLIVTTINASPGTYDTSADGIIALKGAGVSDKIVAAIVAKSSPPSTSHASTGHGRSGLYAAAGDRRRRRVLQGQERRVGPPARDRELQDRRSAEKHCH